MLNTTWYNLTHWEKWPFKVIYFPLTVVWLYYIVRSRAVWFFTPSNPTITFGGFEGEGKKEMYCQLPLHTYPHTIYIHPTVPVTEALLHIKAAGFTYPYIVKPENGMMGLLFRIIDNEAQLKTYHAISPVEYIVQAFSNYPVEVSIFYYRHPTKLSGTVSGFIMKEYMHIVGDGTRTVQQLIAAHPKASTMLQEMDVKHSHNYNNVLPNGEVYYLSYAGNHNRGAKFINLHNQIDAALLALCDSLSNNQNQFYYGRFDVKCASIPDLKAQLNYTILEYNGAGAEPNHIYDCGLTLWQAYKEIVKHWQALYSISKYNHKHGSPYWSFGRGLKFLKQASTLLNTLKAKDIELGAL